MRYLLCKLLILSFIALGANCFADCNSSENTVSFTSCPKTYVSPDQIDFYENGIFVRINDCIIQTESLIADARGIFFHNMRNDGCGPSQWKCEKLDNRGMPCNTCNWDWNYTCYVCYKDKK